MATGIIGCEAPGARRAAFLGVSFPPPPFGGPIALTLYQRIPHANRRDFPAEKARHCGYWVATWAWGKRFRHPDKDSGIQRFR